jgi:diacylglycerol kinase (ATP)
VLGGDGTLNGVINGLRGRDLPIALLPCGSGNDTARGLGLPRHPVAAARALGKAREISIDLGEVAGRLFCNVAGVGLDGEVVRLLATGAVPARGRLAYIAAFLITAANLRASPLSIKRDDGPWERHETLMVSCANGPYYGGGMRIAPGARLDDGKLDICAVLALGRPALLRAFPRVYLGTHVGHPRFRLWQAHTLRLFGARPLSLQADGESAGRLSIDAAHPTLIRIAAHRQRLLVPAMRAATP